MLVLAVPWIFMQLHGKLDKGTNLTEEILLQ